MAKSFISTANVLHPLHSSTSSSSSTSTISLHPQTPNVKKHSPSALTHCKTASKSSTFSPFLTKRNLGINLVTILSLSLTNNGFFDANAATLEPGEDTAYMQEVVYKLGKVGQAIKDNKLSVANSVLGPTSKADWVMRANRAFNKLSSSPEEKTEAAALSASLTSLIASVNQRDIISSKTAFVSSVIALENWSTLTGLQGQLKGL
ncbi:hypothetical protein ACHQM5_029058 [Ranunculus cassubicifolius]